MASLYGQDANGLIVAEAENARLEIGDSVVWSTVTDGDASNNIAMKPNGQTWDRSQAAKMMIDFEITTAGEFELWVRGDTGGGGGAFWLSAGGNAWWLGIDGFKWWRNPGADTLTFAAGKHTLTFWTIHSHVIFDKIALQPVGANVITQNSVAITPNESPSTVFTNFETQSSFSDINYSGWLENPDNNEYRAVLVELDHDAGSVFLASHPYISDRGRHYDNFLINSPSINQTLGEVITVGDIVAANPVDKDWNKYNFTGHQSRIFYGDLRWKKSQFRRIATCDLESDARPTGANLYQFDLGSVVERFNRQFHSGEDVVKSFTVLEAVDWIFQQHQQTAGYQLINIDVEHMVVPVAFTVTENSRLDTLLRGIARSIGAFIRVAQFGQIELVRPDPSVFVTLNNDNIVRNSINSPSTTPAYRYFKVTYDQGNLSVTYDSEVDSGGYSRTLEVETYCTTQADAEKVLGAIAYSGVNKIKNHSLQAIGLTTLMNTGDYARFEADNLQGLGLIDSIERKPLFSDSEIEVGII